MSKLRENLIALMEKNGDNQYTLCEKAHVAQSTLSRILTGYHKDPRSQSLRSWPMFMV